ncbi:MAG: PQQ-dependent sugar dehydrogenase [Planctomycetes bacterium]|nr:PQQ-dependent sugar dehydrogenase [Planctomycetota bacterium]
MKFPSILLAAGLLSAAALAQAPTPLHSVRVVTPAARPIWVGQAPGETTRLYVAEQKQHDIEVWINGVQNPQPFLDLTGKVNSGGNEQGLLGVAFHPDYANNGYVYVNYTRSGDGATVVERYTALTPDDADELSAVPIFGPITQPQSNHNGGNIAFGPDGKLYIGLGDGGNANDTGPGHVSGGNSQAKGEALGKMHRVNDDGSIPSDNPFFGDSTYVQSIWSLGLRNPWRWSFDSKTGDLWIGDVGQDAREEVSFEPAGAGGRNYGWRCMEGFNCTGLSGCTCNDVALTLPIHDYGHGGGKCSVTGGFLYRGKALPDWVGAYFFADYCSAQIWSMDYDGVTAVVTDRTADIAPGGGLAISLITSFGVDNNGELYVCEQGSTSTNGEVYKIVPGGPFTGLGNALEGVAGDPVLWGEGTLVAGSAGALNLRDAAPSASGALFVALSEGAVPFKGGVLVAVPIVSMLTIATGAGGDLQLAWPAWPVLPQGTTIVFQVGINDGAAVKGVSLSNGLRAVQP